MKTITYQLKLFIFTSACLLLCTNLCAQKKPKGLFKTGAKAQAEILKERQTAMMVNGQPVVELELKVTPANGNSFNVKIHRSVSI